MAVLDAALEAAIAGRSRLVLIGGEAGIGKTRLADALASRASARGARVLWGRCWEAGGAPAYWPWMQIVRLGLGATGGVRLRELLGPRAAEVARIVPELLDSSSPPTATTKPEGDEERFRVFEAVAGLLAELTEPEPIVLILEDLHAADEPSLLLLRFVATQITGRRLLMVATYRDDELELGGTNDHRASVVADLSRAPGVTRLSPRGLVESDISAYLEALTPGHGHAGLAAAIQRETEGNPLFMTEVVRLLIEEDRIDQASDLLGRGFGLTEGVRTVIGRRLARLSEPCLTMLGIAALIGTEIDIEILAQLDERSRDMVLADLDEAARAHVVAKPGALSDRWRFAHAMFREVLSGSLPTATRRRLHQRIAEALEQRAGSEPPLAELAFHFAAADNTVKAGEYARRAAEDAANVFAYEEAVRLFRIALGVDTGGDVDRCELLLALGAAANRGGDERLAKSSFLEAAGIARGLGRFEDVARAATGYGGRFMMRRAGDDDQLIPLLEGALQALDTADSRLRALLLARLAGALRDEPLIQHRADISAEAVAIARRIGDPVVLGKTLIGRIAAILGPDSIDELEALLIEARDLAVASGDRELMGDVQLNNTLVALGVGDGDRLRSMMADTAKLARTLRQPSHDWYLAMTGASLTLLEGRLADAEGLLPTVRRQGDRPQRWDADAAFRSQLFLLRREQDRLGEIEELIRDAIVEYPGYRHFLGLSTYIAAAIGRTAEAKRRLDDLARDDFAFLPRDWGWLCAMSFLAETAILIDDRVRAARIEQLLAPYSTLFGTASGDGGTGPVARILGLLAAYDGRLGEALEWLDRAADLNARMGARLWETRIAVEGARVFAERDAAGDRAAAQKSLEGALATARALGLVAIEREALAVAARLAGTTMSSPAPGPAARSGSFRREGDYWAIEYGRAVRLRDSKGLRYLAVLLSEPGRELHVLDLLRRVEGADAGGPASGRATIEEGLAVDTYSAGDVLDPEAKAAYRQRLRELSVELEEAESFNDPGRAELAREEIDALERELAAAFGLGGRARQSISPAERARQSVTKAIREVLRRIEAEDPQLGDHLSRSVRTGTYCIYDPDPAAAPTWMF